MSEVTYFDKYDANGAYHWAECDRRYRNWKRYNPALDARYDLTVNRIQSLGLRGSLLDVGCGDGLLLARVAMWMERVVGIDSEASAIRWAQQKLQHFPNCEVIHTDCYDLPFHRYSFEIVTSADVIEHLKDPAHHLREISRVLKSDGALVLTTPKWRPDRKWDYRHEKEYRADELCALLGNYFDEVEMTYFWPLRWTSLYSTRLGWRILKLVSIQLYNPFRQADATKPERFGQMLAVGRKPRPHAIAKNAASF